MAVRDATVAATAARVQAFMTSGSPPGANFSAFLKDTLAFVAAAAGVPATAMTFQEPASPAPSGPAPAAFPVGAAVGGVVAALAAVLASALLARHLKRRRHLHELEDAFKRRRLTQVGPEPPAPPAAGGKHHDGGPDDPAEQKHLALSEAAAGGGDSGEDPPCPAALAHPPGDGAAAAEAAANAPVQLTADSSSASVAAALEAEGGRGDADVIKEAAAALRESREARGEATPQRSSGPGVGLHLRAPHGACCAHLKIVIGRAQQGQGGARSLFAAGDIAAAADANAAVSC